MQERNSLGVNNLKNKTKPFSHKNISKIAFVSGNTRTGKALILKIISSLNGVEKASVDFLMEQANGLTITKDINKETAIYYYRRAFSILDYNLRIGREVNIRKGDFTSIYEYQNPKKYINNLKFKEGDSVIKAIKREKRIIPLLIHNGLITHNIFLAFHKFVIFEMLRNPVSIISSWINKKYDNKFYYSYRVTTPTIKYKNKILPFYAYGWEDKYLNLNKYERIIEMFFVLERQKKKVISKLTKSEQKKIYFIKLEDLYINPETIISKFEKILGKNRTKFTNKILKKEKLPRFVFKDDIIKKRNLIIKNISTKYYKKLLFLEKNYNETK